MNAHRFAGTWATNGQVANARVGRRQRRVARVLLAGAALASLLPGNFRAAAQTPEAAQDAPQQVAPQRAANQPRWRSLLDGQTLVRADKAPGGWHLADQEEFAEHGKVHVDQGSLVLERGYPATGVRWTGPFPKTNYELKLDAKRTDGGDFFCGLTFPVGAGSLTLILGGWGGWAVGLSCIDGEYAIDNETCTVVQFKQDRWYSVRLRVTEAVVKVWIDDERVIYLDTGGKELTISDRLEPCLPLGLATWYTTGAIRNIRYRGLEEK